MKTIIQCCAIALFTLASIGAMAQDRSISGRITDSGDGTGIPGVNVLVKGTAIGTVTDIDGSYKLSVPAEADILVFSFVGYETMEVTIGSRSVIDIALVADITQLSEVVVVGYGTTLKQDLLGNIASMSSEDIELQPVTSVEQVMQGKTAGVLITSQNGKLGQAMDIRIRGASSISASNQPLYVIDGVPVTSDSQSGSSADTNPLADLNFNDIASLEVLKDASSASIYGSRGANGVVLITTKRGKSGKTKFDANIQYGVSSPTGKREWINAEEYIDLYLEAAVNRDKLRYGIYSDVDVTTDNLRNIDQHPDYQARDGFYTWYFVDFMDWMDSEYIGDYAMSSVDASHNTDWQEEAFQDGRFTQFDISASGGSDATRFYISGTFLDQAGILLGNNFKRFGVRMNLDHKVNDKIEFGLNSNIARTTNERLGNDNLFATPIQLVAQSPLTPVRNANGLVDNNLNGGAIYYPATVENENASRVTTVWRNFFNTYLSWNIIDDLNFRAEYGFDLLQQDEQGHWNSKTESSDTDGYGESRYVSIYNYTTKGYFTYNKSINDVHNIGVVAGMEFQESLRKQTNAEAQGFPVDNLKTLASAAEPIVSSSTLNEFSFIGYFTRINYKLMDKYLFNFTGRYDGSSRFGENNKYGFFPSASVGWIVSEEGFLNNSNVVSFLKLRGSYGNIGNAAIGNYESYGTYVADSYNNNAALVPDQIPNPDLTWETTTEMDIGLDLGLFKDKLSAQIDYYDKQTKNLLLYVPVPGTSGFSTQLQNIGRMENKGFEVVLNYTLLSGDFKWRTGLNYANNKNKILELAPGQDIIPSTSSRYLNSIVVGEPIGVHWEIEYAGVNPANGDALYNYPVRDVNGDPTGEIATTSDYNFANAPENRKNLGNPTPTDIFGWNNTFSFKGIDLSINFQGVSGNKIFLGGDTFMAANARYEDNQTRDQLARWRKPGDITHIPQARLYDNNGASASSRYLSDGAYIRLKSVSLGYTFPEQILDKMKLSNLRVYINGSNLLTFTNYIGWDPEVNTDYRASNTNLGNDFYSGPQARTITFGIRAGF